MIRPSYTTETITTATNNWIMSGKLFSYMKLVKSEARAIYGEAPVTVNPLLERYGDPCIIKMAPSDNNNNIRASNIGIT